MIYYYGCVVILIYSITPGIPPGPGCRVDVRLQEYNVECSKATSDGKCYLFCNEQGKCMLAAEKQVELQETLLK